MCNISIVSNVSIVRVSDISIVSIVSIVSVSDISIVSNVSIVSVSDISIVSNVSIVRKKSCSLSGLLFCSSPVVVFLDRGHPQSMGIPRSRNTTTGRAVKKPTTERATHRNSEDRNAPIPVLKANQSQQSIVIYKVSRNQSTSSPYED